MTTTIEDAALAWIEAVHGCANIEGDHKKQRICETILAALRAKPTGEPFRVTPDEK